MIYKLFGILLYCNLFSKRIRMVGFFVTSLISDHLIFMTNKNYLRGYTTERQLKKTLENKGYFVVRSSGSHSCSDLVAINDIEILLIQVKRSLKPMSTNFVSGLYDEDIKKLQALKVPANCSKELWHWVDRQGFSRFKILENNLIKINI